MKQRENQYMEKLRWIEARFRYKYIKRKFGCWEWSAGTTGKGGYGKFHMDHIGLLAHRVSWVIYKGLIPEGLLVLHSCDNPKCVNPKHLFLGTHMENSRDMFSKGRQSKMLGSRHGEDNNLSKITEIEVKEIRKLRKSGVKYRILSQRFNLSVGQLYQIANGNSWKHVPFF